jgi:DNA-binding CsgD family transcriptional regulator
MTRLANQCLMARADTLGGRHPRSRSGPGVARPREWQAAPTVPDGLTKREAEVLALLSAGCTYKEIGSRLVISAFTAERHINNLYGKIGAVDAPKQPDPLCGTG